MYYYNNKKIPVVNYYYTWLKIKINKLLLLLQHRVINTITILLLITPTVLLLTKLME